MCTRELKNLNRVFCGKSKKNEFSSISKIVVGIALVFFSLGIWGGMQIQSEQSYFDNTIDEVYFEYALATHKSFNPKKSHEVTVRRVQYLTWDLYQLLKYPESLTSKLFYSDKRNNERAEKAWDTLLKLQKIVLEEK